MAYLRNDIGFPELVCFAVGSSICNQLGFVIEILTGSWVSEQVYQNLLGPIWIETPELTATRSLSTKPGWQVLRLG